MPPQLYLSGLLVETYMEKAFSELLAQAPVFVRKLNGEIVYWTSGAEELYGYDFACGMRPPSHGEDPIIVESNSDVTQRENLARELSHRVKNTLAVVQGLADENHQRFASRI